MLRFNSRCISSLVAFGIWNIQKIIIRCVYRNADVYRFRPFVTVEVINGFKNIIATNTVMPFATKVKRLAVLVYIRIVLVFGSINFITEIDWFTPLES